MKTCEGSGDQGGQPRSRGLAVGKQMAHRINFKTDVEIQRGDMEDGFLLRVNCLNTQYTFSHEVLGPKFMIFHSVL